jgi:conjugative relaxase-like TrwC/TraI family protein
MASSRACCPPSGALAYHRRKGGQAMMTIHKLTAGDGYTYLTRQVAGGDVQRERGQDAADYYTAQGNPPGRWAGRGAEILGVAGQQVTEAQMKALFGSGMHPDADQIIADYLRVHVRADMSGEQLAAAARRADLAASLGAPFPAYQPIGPFTDRVTVRVTALESAAGRAASASEVKKIQAEEAGRARAAVAGFDVVFAPVKSAALVWALDERPAVRAAVRGAHEAARDAALALLEEHAAFTRTGRAGIAQLATRGMTMAVFDHYDSRAGEPNLHTHVAVSAKVCGTDGIWRALDARPLYRMTVAASEFYNTRFEIELTSRLESAGYTAGFSARADTARKSEPVREISGVPEPFLAFFSTRRAAIEARYQQLIRDYRTEHGYDPPRSVCHQLARQANLETRDPKGPSRSLEQMRADWRAALTAAFGSDAVAQVMAAIPAVTIAGPAPVQPALDVDAVARRVVAVTGQARSTWTQWNVRAEAERLVRYSGAAGTPQVHDRLAAAITVRALSPGYSIAIDAPAQVSEPASLRRPGKDRQSVFTEHGASRYTSADVLAAEQRLVTAATTPAVTGISPQRVAAALAAFELAAGTRLDPGQRALVTAFATSSRLLAAGLGPAGSGKTTAMRAYAHLAATAGIRVIALAPSAAAADVLAADMGVHADTVHKFLHEHTAGPHAARLSAGLPVPAHAAPYALHAGDIVLVDEAGMAGTLDLDQLLQIATARGAALRLLGDWRQLSAPGCGGALRLIAAEAGAVELTALYRFADPAEAAATLQLRTGDTGGLDFYTAHGRIRAGSLQAMTDAAYAGWKTDMTAGRTTIMTAATTANVTALSARARQDRVTAGQVEPGGVSLHDGNLAGVGDWILTRRNDRRLQTSGGRDWVKNGDPWLVTGCHPSGSLTARRLGSGGTITLPADYVASDVELLYATTTHRAMGGTVDTAHPLVTPGMRREHLYVAATRARHHTTLYVVTHDLPALDPDDQLDRTANDRRMYAAHEILTGILGRQTGEKSATQAIRDTAYASASLAELAPRFQHALEIAVRPAYKRILRDRYGDQLADQFADAPGYAQLRRVLLAAEQAGASPAAVLARAAVTLGPGHQQQPADQLAARLTDSIRDQVRALITGQAVRPPGPMPAWLTIPISAASAVSDDIPPYLQAVQDVITARITSLTDLAAASRPGWTLALGTPATAADPGWRACLSVVAAWRDQHGITTAEPGQVLGPRPEPGSGDEPAWQHAAAALTAAPAQPPRTTRTERRSRADTTAEQFQRALREARHAARRKQATERAGQYTAGRSARAVASTDARQQPGQMPLLPPQPQPRQDRPITW